MINAIALINLMGAFEGLLLSAHFFSRKKVHRLPTLVLGLLLLAFSLPLLNTFLSLSEVVVPMNLVQRVSNLFLWVVGPCFFLFIRYHSSDQTSLKNVWLHFLPFLLNLLFYPYLISGSYADLLMVIGLTQMGVYLAFCVRYMQQHRKAHPAFFQWLQPLFYTFLVVFLVNLALKLMAMSFFIPEVVHLNVTILLLIPILLIAFKEMRQGSNQDVFRKKNLHVGLEAGQVENYLEKIKKAMEEEHLYRQSDLTVKGLANYLGIPVKTVSRLINDHFQQSFTDFITHYRIEDVKRQLVAPENKALKILAIARQAGFNSGGRFNTVFRENTGTTPSAYKKALSQD